MEKCRNIFDKCNNFIHANLFFLVLLFVLNYISLANDIFLQSLKLASNSIFNVLFITYEIAVFTFRLALVVLGIFLIISLIKPRILRRGVQLFIIALCSILTMLDVFSLIHYGHLFDKPMLRVIMATNLHESLEFLHIYLSTVLLVLGICLLVGFVIFLWHRKTKGMNIWKARWTFGVFSIGAVIVIYALIVMPVFIIGEKSSIERVAIMVCQAYEDQRIYQQYYTKLQNHPITLTRNDSTIPNIIFVLGESTTRNHLGIYGYPLQTTPNLQKRKDKGELYVFTDVVSPTTYTMTVLGPLFTFYRNGAPGDFSDYADLIDILRTAGYYTAWISNQESSGTGDIGLIFANRSDEKHFVDIRSNFTQSKYDAAMLPLFQDFLQDEHNKKFCVLHLMGNHFYYRNRYPDDYDIFTPDEEVNVRPDQRQLRAYYDNAVLYNDYIVDEIIRDMEDKDAIVIFLSDHGDDVYDENPDFCGHEIHGNFRMMEVPLVIWTSQSFKEQHPGLEARFANSQTLPFMTDDMIHVFLDILQIETPDYDKTKSLINRDFDSTRKRIYEGMEYSHGPTPKR
jgi:heptose-I-phosphate ethanolaminephosphotransferase